MTNMVEPGWSRAAANIFRDVREERWRQLREGEKLMSRPALIRSDLVKCAAVIFAWIEDLDKQEKVT